MMKWIQKALGSKAKRRRTRGALHRSLGIPVGRKIPMRILLAHRHDKGKRGRRVRLAITLRRIGQKRRRR